jgi:DNA repair protein RecN (Recombination protein N)
VLLELSIRNFAIIEELQLRFGAGFSVLTGETGAGKSIIIDGLNLLLGGRADSTMVRSGANRAEVEGIFGLSAHSEITAVLDAEHLVGDEPDRLVLAREVRSNGRSISRVNGRIVNLGLLREISAGLVDIHGQSEHLSLVRVREHLNLLDRYAGLEAERGEIAASVRRLEAARNELGRLLRDERELARRVDLLNYQIEEIHQASLRVDEEGELKEERTRLANAEQLAELADEARAYLEGETLELPGVRDLVGSLVRALTGLVKIDPSQSAMRELAEQVSYQTEELADLVRDYRDQIEFNPRRLAAVEERIELIRRLLRKYGDSIEEVLEYAGRAQAELETISHSEERTEELRFEEEGLLRAIGKQGVALSEARRAAAVELGAAVERELEDLRMSGSRFEVDIQWRPDPDGALVPGREERFAFDSSGLDQVEFLISPNPGEPLKPMVKIASGGETSRLMLAIKTVLSRADRTPTLVFDEIDQGIGGRVGQTVGIKLWRLSAEQSRNDRSAGDAVSATTAGRQVLCITHLPQLAGFGDAHFRVEKQVVGGRTVTLVRPLLTTEDRVCELALMLGGETPATRDSAHEILEQVGQSKGAMGEFAAA